MTGLVPLHERRELLSDKRFDSIFCNRSHKLYSLLPSKIECQVNLRKERAFTTRCTLITRTGNSFIDHYVNKAMT